MKQQYSVAEIERMRKAIIIGYPCNVPFYPDQRAVEIEARLQTYMQRGIEPKEIEDSAYEAAYQQQQRFSHSAGKAGREDEAAIRTFQR